MQELKKHGLISAETHPSLFAGDKLKCARSEAFWECWRSARCCASPLYVYYMHKHFVLKPFNGAKKEMAGRGEKKKNESHFSLYDLKVFGMFALCHLRD